MCLFLILFAIPSNAQLLDYGPYNGYGLKKGILGNDFGNPLAACITGNETVLPASHSALRANIVYNSDEYKSAFHIDQTAEASFLGYGGGGDELHFGQENSGKSSAFDIIVEGFGEHDSQTINNIKWDPPYDTLVKSGDPVKIQQVREACGDRYIQTVFNEARLFVVMHVSRQQTSTLTKFSGNVHGSVNIDIVTASASLGGDSNVSAAHAAGAISIDVYSEGLGGLIPTAGAIGIANADGLDAIATKLAAYISTLQDKGQPVKYQLSPFPGLPTGDLSQQLIFDQLKDLKGKFTSSYLRLQNVNALLSPGDPRRALLKQPQADQSLQTQRVVLKKYVDAISVAHATCRQSLTLSGCNEPADIAVPPSRPPVELGFIRPPMIFAYLFAVDGTPLTPGQNSLLLSNHQQSLLAAARQYVKSSASNVDLLAVIGNGEYSSVLDVPVLAPRSNAPPIVVGGARIMGQELVWPAYWKNLDRDASVIKVLHADAQHPCNILNSGGLNYVEQDCLTNEGRMLRDVTLADVAQLVSFGTPSPFDFTLVATTTDCFGGLSSLPLGTIHLEMSKGPNVGEVTNRVGLFLPMGNLSVPLIEYVENYSLSDWSAVAQTRLSALAASTSNVTGPNPCTLQVP
jgi:hypothetical protein